MSRWLVYATAGVLLCAGIACLLAASTEWADRLAMVDPMPAEAAEQAGFVLEISAIGVLNFAACLAIVLLRRRVTWSVVVGFQAAVFVAAVVRATLTDGPGWVAFSTLPLMTLVLLIGLRFVNAKLRPSIRSVAG